ncbi:hypothetical protein M413DRAFT_14931 [Hebeloma cylindrosporum]|uniref:Uncharacterized protein n=1 Tax=Hebeloma cylindrosporum TaxID=76867 RepID=A0A0C2X9M8_HEBCY|nr:hypothetical protein M413DRAFT_14931 [Hebeloma cylindrosporum h7]
MAFHVPAYMRNFDRATRFPKVDFDPDRTRGRVQVIDGDIFYSPNSMRTIGGGSRYLISPTRDIASLQRPVWWSAKYAHLAFIPTCEFGPHPLDDLIAIPSQFTRTRKGVWIGSSYILEWNQLQHDLRQVIRILSDRAHIPSFPDVIDSVLVSLGPYPNERIAKEKVMEAKNLFLYWVGQLAYVLAERIAQMGRVGLFVKLLKPDVSQYSVDWFLQFNVPIWYPWGKAESDCASEMSSISRLAPLPYQLQEVASFLHKNPDDILPLRAHADLIDSQPWLAFFAKRQELHTRLLSRERQEDKCKRIQRENQPPKRRTKVFEWLKNEQGVYERVAVDKDDRTEVLEQYGRNQKRYDSFLNEWDCIGDLGEMEADEIALLEWDDEPILHDSHPASSTQFSNLLVGSTDIYQPPPQIHHPGSNHRLATLDELHDDPLNLSEVGFELYEQLGFVAPLQLPFPPPEAPGRHEGFKLVKALGLTVIDEGYWNSPHSAFASKFMRALEGKNNSIPDADTWDLRKGNHLSLGMSKRLSHLKRIGPLFVFDFGQSSRTSWKLAVNKASIALWLCRLDSRLDEQDLSLELTRRGMPHRTLISLRPQAIRMPPSLPLPVRLEGFEFTKSDYKAYVAATKSLLRNRRVARVALMAGGIAWRLAVDQSFELVQDGPTYALPQNRAGVRYASGDPDWEYWDDDLRSWWPLMKTWKMNISLHSWTPFNEVFFKKRLKEIEDGEAVPLTQKEWRKKIRSAALADRIARLNESYSLAFLDTFSDGRYLGLP